MLIQNPNNISQASQNEPVSGPKPVRTTGSATAGIITQTQYNDKLPAQQKITPEQVRNAVNNINQAMKLSSRNLEFSMDHDTNKLVVKMLDSETGELIRQYPSEAVLAIARSIDQFQQTHNGLLFEQLA